METIFWKPFFLDPKNSPFQEKRFSKKKRFPNKASHPNFFTSNEAGFLSNTLTM